MRNDFDLWKFMAGLGLFLYAMSCIEVALKELTGKRFKLFLRKYTTNRFLAILNGALGSALMQSSSIILLMVIAFAGAGLLSLSNSLGIILGANLGTTATGWIVSYVGFKTNIDAVVLPLIAIGCIGIIFIGKPYRLHYLFSLIVSIGLLFMGLNFMKESMTTLESSFNLEMLKQFGFISFFIIGFIITAIIHSSSAMMTIILSALHSNIITIGPAIFMAIGADLGTTMTGLLASRKGNSTKRRVGLAHFFFNVITAIVAILAWSPLLNLIQNVFQITDPLYSLVAFHSSFNIIGIVMLVPFLGMFERFLNRFFINDHQLICKFIHKVSTEVPEASLEAIRLELRNFVFRIYNFNNGLIEMPSDGNVGFIEQKHHFLKALITKDNTQEEYEKIKKTEGELLQYFVSLQKEKLDESEVMTLNQYILALRNGVQSAKDYKDIKHNLKEFQQSASQEVELLVDEIQSVYLPVQNRINHILRSPEKEIFFEELAGIIVDNEKAYHRLNEWIYHTNQKMNKTDFQIGTFLNVNREIFNGNGLLVAAIEDILLSHKDSKNLASIPSH